MSRTYKDKDFFIRFPEEKYDYGTTLIPYHYRYLELPGVKTKKPRKYAGDWKWYKQTPGWFVREFMTVPKRAACRNWEHRAKQTVDFENFEDCPDFGRKPHVYYW